MDDCQVRMLHKKNVMDFNKKYFSIFLFCVFSNKILNKIQDILHDAKFHKNLLLLNYLRSLVTHSDFNTWTLSIRSVKMEDRGQYMCQVTVSFNLKSYKA